MDLGEGIRSVPRRTEHTGFIQTAENIGCLRFSFFQNRLQLNPEPGGYFYSSANEYPSVRTVFLTAQTSGTPRSPFKADF